MLLVKLQNKIHQQNVDVGWWDEPRPFHTFICLFHSELSEAMEGDRKNLMDDHLQHYPMFQVELADFVIRCMDWLGSENWDGKYDYSTFDPSQEPTELLAKLHSKVSGAYNLSFDPYYGPRKEYNKQLESAVCDCFDFAERNQFDLHKIIDEKVAYNKTRADHKRENRLKEGGKKF